MIWNDRGLHEREPRGAASARAAPPVEGIPFGSAAHVQATFARAAAVANRALDRWLARHETSVTFADRRATLADRPSEELQALRAMLRASVTAYVHALREGGAPPERMLVLVKTAIGGTMAHGVEVRALTDDLVRWSIEAFFTD